MDRDKNIKKSYCDAMDTVHASEQLCEKVLKNKTKSKVKKYWVRKVAYVAAATVLLFVSSNAVAYAATGSTWIKRVAKRTVFFCDSDEDVEQKKAEEAKKKNSVPGNSLAIIGENTEKDSNEDKMSFEESVDSYHDAVFYVEEGAEIISDEKGNGEELWTHRLVSKNNFEIKEAYAGTDIADLTSQNPLTRDWDISWLGQNYTPYSNGQLLHVHKDIDSGEVNYSYLYGYFTGKDNEKVSLSSQYSRSTVYQDDYVNENDLDFYEYYTTKDGVEFVIMGNGNRILGELCVEHFDCIIHTTNLTKEDVEEIADNLNLSKLVECYE